MRSLYVWSRCLLQNQSSTYLRKWDRRGVVTEVVPHEQLVFRIDGSPRLKRRFLRLYNAISTSIDTKAFHGWRRDQPSSREENVIHQSSSSSSMFWDDSNDARTVETNEADGDEQTTAPIVLIKKYVPLALGRLKDLYAPGLFYKIWCRIFNRCCWWYYFS